MNGAVYETTMNVFFKIKHAKLYDAVLATPMTPADVALGEIGWAVTPRVHLLDRLPADDVGAGHGRVAVGRAVAVPICVLIGFAFGAMGMALTTYMRSWADFEYVTAVTLPLFLFSATFYPVSSYGSWAWVVQFSPLYHGVALVARRQPRGSSTGRCSAHVGVLAALACTGIVIALAASGGCCCT